MSALPLRTEALGHVTESDASESSARELEKLLQYYAGYQSTPVTLNCHNEMEQSFQLLRSPSGNPSSPLSEEECENYTDSGTRTLQKITRIQVQEPCRIKSAGLGRTMPPPKRFYRSFWQSLSRRILQNRMCEPGLLMMELAMQDNMMQIDT
jgi:hypothetical protein